MPVLICLREKLWTRTYIGDQVPTCPVFTRAKNKVPFWDFSQFAVTAFIFIMLIIACSSKFVLIVHPGHCWRSRDELISDVLLWTPTHGRPKAGRPARTYIQQLCEDTGCSPEDLPEAMNDREKWRERVRDIRATSTTWWWWWYRLILLVLL